MDVEQIIRFAPASLETQLRAKMDTLKSAKSSIAFNRMDYKRRVTAYPQTVENYDGVKVPNNYAILGIPRQASLAEIKKSYRLLAMAYHPDRFQHEGEAARKEAEEEFKKITESYSVLSDQEKRVAYDSKLPKYHHLYPDEVWFKDFERRSDLEVPQQSIDVNALWERVESRLKQYQFVTPQTVVAMLAEEIGLEKDQIGRSLRQVSTVLKEYTAKDGELEGYYAARNDILDRSVKDLGLNLAERKLLAKALFDPRLRAEDIAASKDKASAAEGAAALSDTDIKYRAAIFKTNLIRVLSQNPDKIFVLAIDSDIGSDAKNEIQPTIFKAIDELREIKKPDGTPLLANLRVVRGIGQGLVGQIKNETTEFGNVFIVAKQDNLDQRDCYNEIKGKAWITAINDTAVGKLNYLPVFEAAALTIMTALGADSEAIGRFYTAIADGPIDPAKIAEMRDRRIIYLIPKAMKFDTEKTLRDFNEMVARIHMSA